MGSQAGFYRHVQFTSMLSVEIRDLSAYPNSWVSLIGVNNGGHFEHMSISKRASSSFQRHQRTAGKDSARIHAWETAGEVGEVKRA